MTEQMPEQLPDDARRVREAVASARAGLVDREVLAEVVALCAVAREHLLVIGPPGTAKSEAVRRVAAALGGRYFEYLLGRFTEPHEIFGPVDIRRLREGVVEVETAGMLPEADVAFLDEVFLGSTAILNTLLGVLNERRYRRGRTDLAVPLRICVGAANTLPEETALAAFADRFLARVFVEPVPDARLEDMLDAGWSPPPAAAPPGVCLLDAVDRLAVAAERCNVVAARPGLATAVRRLRAAGIAVTDRRAVRAQRLVAAAAVLDGRAAAGEADLWVLPLVAPTADAQVTARDVLADLIAPGVNGGLVHAADELARGRAARAQRLAAEGEQLLAQLAGATAPVHPDLLLRVEATLREIDAAFDPQTLPEQLTTVRPRLVEAVTP